MREIKFRAKAIEGFETHIDGIEIGDWVYGYYYFDRANMCGVIVTELQEECGGVGSGIMQCHIKVDYKTVGQYTDLKDKNGNEIYEGDIVRGDGFGYNKMGTVYYFTKAWKEFRLMGLFVVGHHVNSFESDGVDMSPIENSSKWSDRADCEVIGNIYENPELLEQL